MRYSKRCYTKRMLKRKMIEFEGEKNYTLCWNDHSWYITMHVIPRKHYFKIYF